MLSISMFVLRHVEHDNNKCCLRCVMVKLCEQTPEIPEV